MVYDEGLKTHTFDKMVTHEDILYVLLSTLYCAQKHGTNSNAGTIY